QGGTRAHGDFAERLVVLEHVDSAELVEIEAVVRFKQSLQHLGTNVDVLGADETTDAAAFMALLDLVPPAVNLIAHHGRLVDEKNGLRQELEQVMFRAGDRGKEFPSRKDAYATGRGRFNFHFLVV